MWQQSQSHALRRLNDSETHTYQPGSMGTSHGNAYIHNMLPQQPAAGAKALRVGLQESTIGKAIQGSCA